MPYLDNSSTDTIWNDCDNPQDIKKGFYVAVSGNTGSGKSTLVKLLADKLRANGDPNIIAVNERVFHHPLLKLMFREPGTYSFLIQLNFLLQRHLCLKRLLSLGKTIVIERSHLDDTLFLEHLYEENFITEIERALYLDLSVQLNKDLREPDLWLCLNIDAQTSYERVTSAEASGERPVEFPNDVIKLEFIQGWSKRYNTFFDSISSKSQVVILDSNSDPTELIHQLQQMIDGLKRMS